MNNFTIENLGMDVGHGALEFNCSSYDDYGEAAFEINIQTCIIEGSEEIGPNDDLDGIVVNGYASGNEEQGGDFTLIINDANITKVRHAIFLGNDLKAAYGENSQFQFSTLEIDHCWNALYYDDYPEEDAPANIGVRKIRILTDCEFRDLKSHAIYFGEHIPNGNLWLDDIVINTCQFGLEEFFDGIHILSEHFTVQFFDDNGEDPFPETITNCDNGIYIGGDHNDIRFLGVTNLDYNRGNGIYCSSDWFKIRTGEDAFVSASHNIENGLLLDITDISEDENDVLVFLQTIHANYNGENGIKVIGEKYRIQLKGANSLCNNGENGLCATVHEDGENLIKRISIAGAGEFMAYVNSNNSCGVYIGPPEGHAEYPMKNCRFTTGGTYYNNNALGAQNPGLGYGIALVGVNSCDDSISVRLSSDTYIFKDFEPGEGYYCYVEQNHKDGIFIGGSDNHLVTEEAKIRSNRENGVRIITEPPRDPNPILDPDPSSWLDTESWLNGNYRNGALINCLTENVEAPGSYHLIDLYGTKFNYNASNEGVVDYECAGLRIEGEHITLVNIVGADIWGNGVRGNEDDELVYGVRVEDIDNKVRFEGTVIQANVLSGICLVNGSMDNNISVDSCSFLENLEDGIQINSSNTLTVTESKFYKNAESGIEVNSSYSPDIIDINNCVLIGDDFNPEDDYDESSTIYINDAENIFIRNNWINGGYAGVYIEDDCEVRLSNNIFDYTTEDEPPEFVAASIIKTVLDVNSEVDILHNHILSYEVEENVLILIDGTESPTIARNIVVLENSGSLLIDASAVENTPLLSNVLFIEYHDGYVFGNYVNGNVTLDVELPNTINLSPSLFPFDPEGDDDILSDMPELKYHLLWDSPAINIVGEDNFDEPDPRSYANGSEEDPADAGAFGGPYANTWTIKYVEVDGFDLHEICFTHDLSIAPFEFGEPENYPDNIHLDNVGDNFKREKYLVLVDMILEPTANEDITQGTEFHFHKTNRRKIIYPSPLQFKTNRYVDFMGTSEYPINLCPADKDYEEGGFGNPRWQGLNIFYSEDVPERTNLLNYTNFTHAKVGLRVEGTVGGAIASGNYLNFENCLTAVHVFSGDNPPRVAFARIEHSVFNAALDADVDDQMVLLEGWNPQYLGQYNEMDGEFRVGHGILRSVEGEQNCLGIFGGMHSTYENFVTAGVSLHIHQAHFVDCDFTDNGDYGVKITNDVEGGMTNHMMTNCRITDCGGNFLQNDDGTTFGGLVISGIDLQLLNTTITNCYGANLAIMDLVDNQRWPYCQNIILDDQEICMDAIEYGHCPEVYVVEEYQSAPIMIYIGADLGPTIYNSNFKNNRYVNNNVVRTEDYHIFPDRKTPVTFMTGNWWATGIGSPEALIQEGDNSEVFYIPWVEGEIEFLDFDPDIMDQFHEAQEDFVNEEWSDAAEGFVDFIEADTANESGFSEIAAWRAVRARLFADSPGDARDLLEELCEEYEGEVEHVLSLRAPWLNFFNDTTLVGMQTTYDEYDTLRLSMETLEDSIFCALQQLYLDAAMGGGGRRAMSGQKRIDEIRRLKDLFKKSGGKKTLNPETALPKKFELYAAYPNPFNSSTIIRYDVPKSAHVIIQVYNVLGQRVQTLFSGKQMAGSHKIILNNSHLASGLYFAVMRSGSFNKTRKLMLLK
ncbi:MAG: right-handed parallel beta-helix repeat-containing protein [Candidatus Electryonea clarkiae]|nr:right-handed parallel beta-helix repeat-containing protein [Candidatus Electryonea clarkiae]